MGLMSKTKDGIRIAFDDFGSGEPALLCMPGWASDRFQFDPIARALSANRRVLVLDWRGHGESDRSTTDYAYEHLLEDALSVIEAAGIERFVAVAASHAGWAAVDLRRRVGERMTGFVAISWMMLGAPPPFLAGLERLQQPDGWTEVRDQLFQMWRGGGDDPGVEEQIARMNGYDGETWMRAGREIARAYHEYQSPVRALARLEPHLPTLHIYAQPDDPALLEGQQEFAAKNAWFGVTRIDARSHFPQFEAPEEVARLVEEFAADAGR